VPPYTCAVATLFSPALASDCTVAVMAAMPEANASPAIPPSSGATRCSSTSVVGFMIRV